MEAFLGLDGLYMGIGREESITLEDFSFVKSGSVQVGGYTYDRPSEESDARLIPFGDVPPVVFSEVMGDLARIAGQSVGGETGDALRTTASSEVETAIDSWIMASRTM